MFIRIKTLNSPTSDEIQLEVSSLDTIEQIKSRLSAQLNIPINQQKLVLKGKPLHDGSLRDHQIIDGTKLHLFTSTPTKVTSNTFQNELRSLASKWIRNTNEREAFVTAFEKEMKHTVDNLSLDDIEKLCSDRLHPSV